MLRTVAVVYLRETIQSVRLYFMFRLPLVARVRFSRFNYGYIKSGIRSDPEVVVLWSLMRFGEAALPRRSGKAERARSGNAALHKHCHQSPLPASASPILSYSAVNHPSPNLTRPTSLHLLYLSVSYMFVSS